VNFIYQKLTNLFSHKLIWLFTSIVLLSTIGNAQINNSDFAVRLEPEANLEAEEGTSEEIIFIKAKKENLHGLNLTFTLPQGIEYIVGSMQILVNPNNNYTVIYNTSSSLTQPEFQIRNTSGGGTDNDWVFLDELKLSFNRRATCDAVTFKEAGGIFKDRHKIDYFIGSTAKSAQDFDDTVSSYGLLSASLSVTDIASITGEISNIAAPIYYTRDIQDVQGGNGDITAFHHEIKIGSSIFNYELKFNGTVMTPASTETDATTGVTKLIFDIDLTQAPFNVATARENGDGQYMNGESFTFQEKFAVLSCENSEIIHSSYWNCQRSSEKSGSILLGTEVPGLKLTKLEGSNDILATNHTRVKIENTTTVVGGHATDVYINIGLGHNDSDLTTYGVNPMWAYDWANTKALSNVHFTGGPATLTTFDNPATLYPTRGSGNSVAIPPNFLTTDPDGAGVGLEDLDGDGFFDDMAPGASTIIEMDIDYTARDLDCVVGRQDYIRWEHLYFDVNIKDQCYMARDAKRLDFGYRNLTTDYYHETKIGGVTDVTGGQPFEITFQPAMYSNIDLNGHNAISNADDSEFSVIITVPTGVSLDPANPVAGLSQVGNTITYTTTNLYNYPYILTNVFADGVLKLPLLLNCADYNATNTTSAFTVDYLTHLTLKDAGGIAGFDQDIHCGTSELIQTHGCAADCDGPAITKFDTFRTTAGYTDNTMTAKVDLATIPETEKDRYLVGDNMRIVTEAKIQNFSTDKLFIDIKYTTDGTTLGANDIQFVDGTIHIFDATANNTTADQSLTITPTITSSGNDHIATFDISSYKSLFDSNLFEEEDLIFVTVNYKFNTNQTGGRKLHKLTNFKGEYHSVDTSNDRVSCDTYGSTASYLKVTHSIGKYEEEFANCDEGVVRAWSTEGADVEDLHPNEYRPPFGLNKMIVTLPDGFKFTGRAEINNQQGVFTVAGGDLTATQVGNIVTITPTTSFRNGDQRATYFPSTRVWIKGTCGANEQGNVTFEGKYNEFHYGDNTPEVPLTTTKELHYTKPSFSLQSGSSSIVNGDASEATFDIVATNTSPGDGSIDFNWIKVASAIDVNTAQDLTDVSNPIDLEVKKVGGIAYVEIGALTNGTFKNIQIKAGYSSCTEQTVNFAHGWDCDTYPTNYANQANLCYENNVDLTLLPRASEIQLKITEQPDTRITMCDPFTIELEVNSAQFAGVINPRVEFSIPGLPLNALEIQSIKLGYPYDSATLEDANTTINSNVLSINLGEHSVIKALGELLGTNKAVTDNDRKVKVILDLKTTCDFVSSTPLQFKAFGNKPCGEAAEGNGSLLYSEKIRIDGAEQPYDAFTSVILPDNTSAEGAHIDYCGTTETVTISTLFSDIIGQATTKTEDADFGDVIMPNGVSFVDGSFSSSDNITVVGYDATTNVLTFQFPEGLVNLDRVDFTFSIISDANGGCATDADFTVENYVIAANVLCNGVACTTTKIITGSATEPLDILKPSLVDSGATTATAVADSGKYAYRVNLSLANNGLEATTGYTYDIFCADDSGNPLGAAINSGTIDQAIPAGGTITQTISFDKDTFCNGGKIAFVINSNENCLCETLNLPIDLNANSTLEATANFLDSTFECDGSVAGTFEVLAEKGSPAYQYSIDNGVTYQTENTFTVTSSGDYTVTVKDSQGFTVDTTITITLEEGYQPMTIVYESVDSNKYKILATGGLPPYEYAIDNQNDFGTDDVFKIDHTGTYTLYVKDAKECIVELQADLVYSGLQIPNFFTPDGDGTNDTWYPKHIDLYPNISVSIFDRYQRLIIRYNGNMHSWDGSYNGKLLPSGDYWYIIRLNDPVNDKEFKGSFTLYR